MPCIHIDRSLRGSILDIGGGGEGVIGRVYGDRVIAIDNRQSELDEAPGGFEKRLMDARTLEFADGHFDNVTFFYALMYMPRAVKRRALSEAVRVLRSGGRLAVWDAALASAWPEPFVVSLDVTGPDFALHTDYGVGGEDLAQDGDMLAGLAGECGCRLVEREECEGQLRLLFIKESHPC